MCCHQAGHLSPPPGTRAIGVEADGLVVAADGEGGGADELVSAHTLVQAIALFAWLISHQTGVLFSHNKLATSNQPAVLFSQNKSAPAISHQPTEQAVYPKTWNTCVPCHLHYAGEPRRRCLRHRCPGILVTSSDDVRGLDRLDLVVRGRGCCISI
jgi:hypothetical protein